MEEWEKRAQLLKLLDERIFQPVLDAPLHSCVDAQTLREVQSSVNRTRSRYLQTYATAAAVKEAFLSDLRSDLGKTLAAKMRWLKFTCFEDITDEFLKTCRDIQV